MKSFVRFCMLFGVFVLLSVPAQAARPEGIRVAQASGRAEAKKLKKQGDDQLRAGKRKEAEQTYQQAVKADPAWYGALEALGNFYFSSRRYDEAIAAFEKAVKIEARYHTGLYNIAFAYRKARKYDKAVEYYKRYITQQAKDPDAYYGLAASYESMGKKKEAMEGYLLYAEKETRPSERKYVVKAKEKAEQLRKELATGSKPKPVLVTKPKPVLVTKPKPVLVTKPKPVLVTKPKPVLVTKPKPVLVTKPKPATSPKVAQLLADGDAAMAAGSNAKAIKAFFDASQLEPNNAEALYKLGTVYLKTGNSKAAKFKWKKVLSIKPGHPGAMQGLARLEAKPSPTAAKVKAAPIAKPTPLEKKVPAKLSAADRKRLDKILAEADKHFKVKAFSQAIAAYTKATRMDPTNEEALFKLGVAYAMSGNYNVAIYKWQQVMELNPGNVAARRNIERAKAKLLEKGKPMPKAPAGVEAVKAQPKAQAKPKAGVTKAFDKHMAKAQQMKAQGNAKGVLDATVLALKIRSDADAFQLKGEALVILKRYSSARRAFSQAMVQDPNRAGPFYGLAEACRLAGDMDRARYYYKMYTRSKAADKTDKLVQRAERILSAK
ncbi:MAG: tetratricopeptide repeat protein [Deltaproteobacteria bacterium]|nr:tetratricopeptide repeat protein [Deltaproteobacteria bacterium]